MTDRNTAANIGGSKSSSNTQSSSAPLHDQQTPRLSSDLQPRAVDSKGKALVKTYQPAVIDWEHIDKTRFYTLAPIAGILTRIILYPTTLVKTRLQVQKQVNFCVCMCACVPLCVCVYLCVCVPPSLSLTRHTHVSLGSLCNCAFCPIFYLLPDSYQCAGRHQPRDHSLHPLDAAVL